MAIVGLHAPTTPLFYMTLCEEGLTVIDNRRLRSGCRIWETGDYLLRLGINLPNRGDHNRVANNYICLDVIKKSTSIVF
jgi:hypothetical protein